MTSETVMDGGANGHAPHGLQRRDAVRALLVERDGLLVVTGLGSPAWDVMAAGDNDRNFYLWGAMGGAAMIGLGLALAQRDEDVAVITGDGEQLMALGALATIAAAAPGNLSIIVLDNRHYGETGMQPSHTGLGVDLVQVARGCGFNWSLAVNDEDRLRDVRARLRQREGPGFASVSILPEDPPRALPPRDGVELKNRFRRQLGFGTI